VQRRETVVTRERRRFASFQEFYPYYLAEHSNRSCRRLHFFGTSLVLATLAVMAWTGGWASAIALPVLGYGPAWAGHFFFEKNRPATFTHPLYSLVGDFRMYYEMLSGRIAF
jgi:hypothetical protein